MPRALPDLERLCAKELSGYDDGTGEKDFPTHRLIPVFASTGQINLQYIGWQGDVGRIFEYMEANPESFVPQKLAVGSSLGELEERVARGNHNSVFSLTKRVGDLNSSAANPDLPVYLHGRWSSMAGILTAIRTEVSRQLLRLLPGAQTK